MSIRPRLQILVGREAVGHSKWDQTSKVWDAASGQELLILRDHTLNLTSVAWSPDGKWLATGSADGTGKVWDAASGREVLTLQGHHGSVSSVAWSPDGKRLAPGSGDEIGRRRADRRC